MPAWAIWWCSRLPHPATSRGQWHVACLRLPDPALVLDLAELKHHRHTGAGRDDDSMRMNPALGNPKLPPLPLARRRKLLGRHEVGQVRRLVERPDLDH